MSFDKAIPQNIEAEEAVIGSLLIDPDALLECLGSLKLGDFIRESHQWVYEACLALYQRGVAINQITVAQELAQKERLEAIGGSAHLIHLVSIVPTSLHVEYYANIVHRLAVMRRLITAGGQIAAVGYAGGEPEETATKARKILDSVLIEASPQLGTPLDLAEAILRLCRPRSGTLPLPWPTLQELTGPMSPGQYWIIAARTSIGKTTALLQIALSLAQAGKVVLYGTAEELIEDIAARVTAMTKGLNLYHLQNPQDEDKEKLIDASGWASEHHFWPVTIGNIGDLERWYGQCKLTEEHVDIVLVDYAQIVADSEEPKDVTALSHKLKQLCNRWEVPLVVASQFRRVTKMGGSDDTSRPTLSMLRASGALENDSHVVILLHRAKSESFGATKEDTTEFIVAKNRLLGRHGSIKLAWDKQMRQYVEE